MSARVFAAEGPWLFSRRVDLLAFGGSALASWLLVGLGAALGLLDRDTPLWALLVCVVAIDVAHVWSTGFRVYFDGGELRARPLLYLGVPALAYLLGVALYAVGALAFWRALAYVAVFHFVRQQAGFLKLYARRSRTQTPLASALEQATLHASMLYPLVHWHAHLPRSFAWFVQGDFVAGESVAALAQALVGPLELACHVLLGAFLVRQGLLMRRGEAEPGKSVLVVATFVCWVPGIVLFDSDYVFTVTNVVLHGVPYFVLTHRYARAQQRPSWARRLCLRGVPTFLLVCFALALAEESLWEGLVWHAHVPALAPLVPLSARSLVFVVPLLAVPQLTHYVLDGYVWRVRSENPVLRRELE